MAWEESGDDSIRQSVYEPDKGMPTSEIRGRVM